MSEQTEITQDTPQALQKSGPDESKLVSSANRRPAPTETVDYMKLETVDDFERLAKIMYDAGVWDDLKSQATAVVKIMAGREMGMAPIEAMTDLHLIDGKIESSYTGKLKAINRHPRYRYRVIQATDTEARVAIDERYDDGWVHKGTAGFTLSQAKKANLTEKKNWKYTEDLLLARAVTRAVRRFCPEVDGPSGYTRGEIETAGQTSDVEPMDAPDAPDQVDQPDDQPGPDAQLQATEQPDQSEIQSFAKEARDRVVSVPEGKVDDEIDTIVEKIADWPDGAKNTVDVWIRKGEDLRGRLDQMIDNWFDQGKQIATNTGLSIEQREEALDEMKDALRDEIEDWPDWWKDRAVSKVVSVPFTYRFGSMPAETGSDGPEQGSVPDDSEGDDPDDDPEAASSGDDSPTERPQRDEPVKEGDFPPPRGAGDQSGDSGGPEDLPGEPIDDTPKAAIDAQKHERRARSLGVIARADGAYSQGAFNLLLQRHGYGNARAASEGMTDEEWDALKEDAADPKKAEEMERQNNQTEIGWD